MPERLSYDPMCALAFRLGTPLGADFLEQEAVHLTDEFGASFVDDLRLIVQSADLSAADRVFHTVAPGGSFRAFDRPGTFVVLYRAKGVWGRLKANKLPDFPCSLATVVVNAASSIRLKRRSEARRVADAALTA